MTNTGYLTVIGDITAFGSVSDQRFKKDIIPLENSMDLITADGGFDFSYDFNNQETECVKLILCQICFAIAICSSMVASPAFGAY